MIRLHVRLSIWYLLLVMQSFSIQDWKLLPSKARTNWSCVAAYAGQTALSITPKMPLTFQRGHVLTPRHPSAEIFICTWGGIMGKEDVFVDLRNKLLSERLHLASGVDLTDQHQYSHSCTRFFSVYWTNNFKVWMFINLQNATFFLPIVMNPYLMNMKKNYSTLCEIFHMFKLHHNNTHMPKLFYYASEMVLSAS